MLEPRSMLERVTDFMSYPHMVFGAEKLEDPIERFNKVLTYFLAGWNIRPKVGFILHLSKFVADSNLTGL